MTTLNTLKVLALASLVWATPSPALAAPAPDNDRYGETRWNKLPLRGALSKTPWVGSWWAYKRDGSAYRIHDETVSDSSTYATEWERWSKLELAELSPAEKYDYYMGRVDQIEYDGLLERAKSIQEVDGSVSGLMDERRELIRKLNRAIEDHRDDESFDWKETDDGERYLEVKTELEEKEAAAAKGEVTVDTAFEYEVLSHGTAQFGVGSWFGHCNAWAAAAIMEPEPRQDSEVSGIPFTSADVKAYLTELYMEIQSSFYGSRNDFHDDESARAEIDFRDVTPATFHISFADRIGNKDQGFVIDRHTGSEVWNQPVRAFRSSVEPLYETVEEVAKSEPREITYTQYGHDGSKLDERGEAQVYPVLVTTTIHWMSDGLPASTLTDQTINDDLTDQEFANSWGIHNRWHEQVEIRTLTYELWLDLPMTDPEARIIGDGVWEHGSGSGFTQLHPDFIWVPLADLNTYRDYENEFFDYETVVEQLLPGTLEPHETQAPAVYTAAGPAPIPDDAPEAPATLSVQVDTDAVVHRLTVDVSIVHSYISDLRIWLRAPDGTEVDLRPVGLGGSADDIEESYDVHDLDGASSLGEWTLLVADHAGLDDGQIERFSLHIH
jgi:hypothetical protein